MISFLSKKSANKKTVALKVQTGDELLSGMNAYILKLAKLTSLPKDAFKAFYKDTLVNLAEYVQLLPASEMHHHSVPGGLLTHLLETSCNALTLRRGELLPPGVQPEVINKKAELWTYAVFTCALLHDIGKVIIDQEVIVCDKDGKQYGFWNPLAGPISKNKFKKSKLFYRLRFRKDRQYRTHERLGFLAAQHIIPDKGMSWIKSDNQVFESVTALLTGHKEDAGILGHIILEADRISVSKNLGANTGVVKNRSGNRPLHEKLLLALRYLLTEGQLPINRSGAAVFVNGDDTWLVCKRVADSIRDHLLAEGHTGVPNNNDRIFDVLQEHHLIIPNEERAIWSCEFNFGGKPVKLTMLRMPSSRIWPNSDRKPDDYQGVISILDDAETADPIDQQTKDADNYSVQNTPETITEPTPEQHEIDSIFDDAQSKQEPNNNNVISDGQSVVDKERVTPADRGGDNDVGERFLDWVFTGLEQGNIKYNSDQARIHVVDDGLLLVTPAVFKEFEIKHPDVDDTWKYIQKKFQKLGKHLKTNSGTNIHKFEVTGGRRKSKLHGYIVSDIDKYLSDDLANKLKPNKHLTPLC